MKKLVLNALKSLQLEECEIPVPEKGFSLLKVLCCAICKTDSKMWDQGHRDLVFPRVLGHEMVVTDYPYLKNDSDIDGKSNSDDSSSANSCDDNYRQRYVVWPGQSCGYCRYCVQGRENLCEKIRITGFDHDGGFAEFVVVPTSSLIPLPPPNVISDTIGCFAEPVGCILNAFDKLKIQKGEKVLIYGGGTLGMIAALACCNMGATAYIIEKKEEKIKKITKFIEKVAGSFQKPSQSLDIPIISTVKDTIESEFDAVINCCADHTAFNLSIVKVAKGGKISFFSGITKNEHIETNIANLLHYKEVELNGVYGLTRKNMLDAISFIETNTPFLEMLVEDIIAPEKAVELMPQVLSGSSLKYIIDFRESKKAEPLLNGSLNSKSSFYTTHSTLSNLEPILSNYDLITNDDEKWCYSLISTIVPVNQELLSFAQGKIDNKTKPLGSLGTLEDIAIQMSLIQQSSSPIIRNKFLLVFAGDHGVTEEGVSAYPSEVTKQMVKNFLNGGAAINVLCRHHNIEIKIVDIGVNGDFEEFTSHPNLIQKKVRKGTRNFVIEPAMTDKELFLALRHGMEVFLDIYHQIKNKEQIVDIVGLGEMGIGNTTSASAIISTITGITPLQATGRGTGVDNKTLDHKANIIKKAIDFHKPDPQNGFDILRKVGGYEIAGITGAVLAASSKGCAVVLDGVISTAAGLIAYLIKSDIKGYLISGHKSVEFAQKAALDYMGLKPVIDFGMRLGEGTGAALTINTAEAACKIMCEMASFDEAKVATIFENKNRAQENLSK